MKRRNRKDEENQKKITKYNVVLTGLNVVIVIIQVIEELLVLIFK
ncbi:hypothetical protein [Staphylococcus sp. GDY8P218P]|nr:hypothetical protein [Staphylococcus sp. GDY8P218P]